MTKVSIKENSWIARIASKKLGGTGAAIVIGKTIHVWGVSREKFLGNKRWVRHELKHVEQFEQHGLLPFIAKYLWHSLFLGYHNCCYEKEAREAEKDEMIIAKYVFADNETLV
ncbi:MAG: DUF4157 domain-containing protein [Sphingobacteriales bacterium]|jgi:hypothetical protein|nr:DUF4157 domain-containing protein [Sphingobacteriales bacterium]